MADVWEIAQHVEDHPEDNAQRWRLAKKLYKAWEYRLALEHLQILKNEEPGKLNMRRYLAATYYRLGRYDDACKELEEIVEQWPDEISVREQYARTLEVADRKLDAAKVWEDIVERQPDHPLAARAATRLRRRAESTDSPQEDLKLHDSDSGIDIKQGITCPECGVQNSTEFELCWQCHASLTGRHTPTPRPKKRPQASISWSPSPITIGAAIVILSGLAVFLTLRQFGIASIFASGNDAPIRISTFLMSEFAVTHLVLGVTAVIVWPLALRFTFGVLWPGEVHDTDLTIAGVLFALFAYAVSWLPGTLFFLSPVLSAIATLLVIALYFEMPWGKAFGAWAMQGALVTAIGVAVFVALEGIGFLRDIPAITRHATALGPASDAYGYRWAPLESPLDMPLQWTPSGAGWLDERANTANIVITAEQDAPGLKAELRRQGEILDVKTFDVNTVSMMLDDLAPATPYELDVYGEDGVPLEVVIRSILIPRISK